MARSTATTTTGAIMFGSKNRGKDVDQPTAPVRVHNSKATKTQTCGRCFGRSVDKIPITCGQCGSTGVETVWH